jgi:hypothetical protein
MTPVAVFVAVSVTPGKTAPDASATVPLSVPLLAWPNAEPTKRHNKIKLRKNLFIVTHHVDKG